MPKEIKGNAGRTPPEPSTDHSDIDGFAILRPNQRRVVRRVSAVGKLDNHAILDRPFCETCLQLFNEKVGRFGLRLRFGQILQTGDREELVASRLPHPLAVDEDECVVGEEGLIAEAGGDCLGLLHELEGERA